MSDYIDKYKKRMNRNGSDLGQAYNNNTISFIESTFHASPTFRKLSVKSFEKPHIKEMDARIVEMERMGTLREVLLRPSSEGLNEGTYIGFDNHTWLIFDKYGANKVIVSQCNRKLKWYDKQGVLHSLDCIASSQDLGSKAKQSKNEIEFNKFDVKLPTGQLFVFVELRPDTELIDLGYRFVFGRKVYEVIGIDDTTTVRESDTGTYGILQLTVKVTTIREEDDIEEKIAQNIHDDSSVVVPEEKIVTEGEITQGDGGRIW